MIEGTATMTASRGRVVCAAAVAALVVAWPLVGWGQESILRFTLDPVTLEVAPGGTVHGRLTLKNVSPYEADEVEVSWSGGAEASLARSPEPVEVVDAFGSASIPLSIAAAEGATLGDFGGSLEVLYSYCIGDLCYQIVDAVPVALRVVPAAPGPPDVPDVPATPDAPSRSPVPWSWIAFGLLTGLVLSAGFAARRARARLVLAALVAALAGGALWIGASLGQHTQAQAVGAVLCTSCVGIETVRTDSPRLTSAQAAAIDRVTQRIELLVFYAEWCRSCPYAEALADLVAARNDRIAVRHVDAEAERELATRHGVTRTGRTVVPAIVRVDTGEVLFGVENLGDRLVELLGDGP